MKNASFQIEEDCPTFRPFTRESLAKIEARLEEVNEKKRELEKKRAEGEVNIVIYFGTVLIKYGFDKLKMAILSLNLIF